MRSLTTDMQAAIVAGVLAPAYFVALQFDSGTKYMWTGVGTVLWNGQDWEGQGDFLGVSQITQTSDLSAESITISLSGLNADDVSSAMTDVSASVNRRCVACFLERWLDHRHARPYVLWPLGCADDSG